MDPAQRERRIGILVVILVLLIVVLFWMLHPHKLPFSTEQRETKTPPGTEGKTPSIEERKAALKKTLESIRPPAGDQLGKIRYFNGPDGDISGVMVDYSTKANCAALGPHYKKEFAKQGFTYTGKKDDSDENSSTFLFSSRDYIADVGCPASKGPIRQYVIIMWSKSHA